MKNLTRKYVVQLNISTLKIGDYYCEDKFTMKNTSDIVRCVHVGIPPQANILFNSKDVSADTPLQV